MTKRDEIPPCSCQELRSVQWADYGQGNVACERHPNASAMGHDHRVDMPIRKPTKGNAPGSLANLEHWHEVHAAEWERRKHLRDDEEPEWKAWVRR